MGELRRLTMRSDERVGRWLWFAVAYVAVILLLLWLGQQFGASVQPSSGWFE